MQASDEQKSSVANRPMNIFERRLLELMIPIVPKRYRLEPQYVVDGRFTLDFAVMSKTRKIAIELDGAQHEIIGGLPVFEDRQRDGYLRGQGWQVVRISVHQLITSPGTVQKEITNLFKRTQS